MLRKISNLERWPKNAIPKCIASMMYAEHVLRMTMDWSTLQRDKFGFVGDALSKCEDVDIPYSPLLQWFRENLKLLDEPRCTLLEGQEPKRPCLRRTTKNDMDMILEEAFAIMDMDVYGE